MGHAAYDWNHDNDNDDDGEQYRWYSCEEAPVYLSAANGGPLNDNYYWGEFCGYPGGSKTNGDNEFGIASEYDWTRFFWDMDTDYGHTFEDLLTVLTYADPYTWIIEAEYNTTDTGYDPAERPWQRMADGAQSRLSSASSSTSSPTTTARPGSCSPRPTSTAMSGPRSTPSGEAMWSAS